MEYTEELEEVQGQDVQYELDEYDFWHNEQDVF